MYGLFDNLQTLLREKNNHTYKFVKEKLRILSKKYVLSRVCRG